MVDSINRFCDHPDDSIVSHIIETFVTDAAIKLTHQKDNRISHLKKLYQRQLKEFAQFVRYFEMRDNANRIQYYLFFASNHRLGHLKMKQAMWKVDPNGKFNFSDATNPNQTILFQENSLHVLREILLIQFKGQRKISCSKVRQYVEDETAFLKKHMGDVLKNEELVGKIKVEEFKTDGKKRKLNSYPDNAIITFL
jgi:hypothetical protein